MKIKAMQDNTKYNGGVIKNIETVYADLIKPSSELKNDIAQLKGDILILGAGGKMGPALAKLAKKAIDEAGLRKKVIAVSRFSDPQLQNALTQEGVETISADLLDEAELESLPDVKNVLYLAGTKFGTSGNESFTWAMNAYLPGRVAEKYKNSNIVVFSSGNVYHLSAVTNGGSVEESLPAPVGEYAQSCLGRERIFQFFSLKYNTPILIYRLNYANDVGYGVLLELAKSVFEGKPVDLSMGNVNTIWQGDANEIAIRSLLHCSVPHKILNVTGPETLSVRWLAEEFGRMFIKRPQFLNEESSTALLSNAAESFRLFGYPKVRLKQVMQIIGEWVIQGKETINKPTHFQERQGKY